MDKLLLIWIITSSAMFSSYACNKKKKILCSKKKKMNELNSLTQ